MTQVIDPVLMPMIRRVMPHIFAQQIAGVQPMTSPTASIFGMRAKYKDHHGKFFMNKELYKTFLRINDRKKSATRQDFYRAGYPYVDANLSKDWREMHKWCELYIGKNRYVWFGERFFFENEDDRLIFMCAGWA